MLFYNLLFLLKNNIGNYSAQAQGNLSEQVFETRRFQLLYALFFSSVRECPLHYYLIAEVGVNFLSFVNLINENLHLSVILLTFT